MMKYLFDAKTTKLFRKVKKNVMYNELNSDQHDNLLLL